MTDEFEKTRGTVKSYKPVTNTQVQVELDNMDGVFQLSISQYWSLDKGDDVSLAFRPSSTGMFQCWAYKNHTKNLSGWNELPSIATGIDDTHKIMGTIFIVLGALLCLTIIGAFVGIPFILVGNKFRKTANNSIKTDAHLDHLYQQARELVT